MSDWNNPDWSLDQLKQYAGQIGERFGWTSSQLLEVTDLLEQLRNDEQSFWIKDHHEAQRFLEAARVQVLAVDLDGVEELHNVIASALGTTQIETMSDREQGAGDIVAGTVLESAENLRGAGELGGKVVKSGTDFLATPAGKAVATGGAALLLWALVRRFTP